MFTQNLSKSVMTLAAVAIVALMFSTTSANAAGVLAGQLGILDLAGINPATGVAWAKDDTYRLVFVTTTKIDATSSDIAVYNTHVQNEANGSSLGLGAVSWTAIASTGTIDARDNTNTNPGTDGVGEAILLLNGTQIVANNYADLWDGLTNAQAIDLDEEATTPPVGGLEFPGNGWANWSPTWTGTKGDGTAQNALGNGGNVNLGLASGAASAAQWVARSNGAETLPQLVYGISEVLVVDIPTPAALPPGLALIGLAAARRRRMK